MRLRRDKHGEVTEDDRCHGITGHCTLCGDDSTACWVGTNGAVEVCPSCATGVLPALTADAAVAVCPLNRTVDSGERVLIAMTVTFWKAALSRVAVEAQQRFTPPEVQAT